MNKTRIISVGVAVMAAPFVCAQDVTIIGEVHDNPAHHRVQADHIADISPSAVVFEMLTPEEATTLAPVPRDPDSMRMAIEGFHWSNIADYAEVLAASKVIVGAALPREDVRAAFEAGAAAVFGDDAARFSLDVALPQDQQETREDMQFAAHCEAMPRELMSGMVEAQRLRDAAFARSVLHALDQYGAPVVLITGNGHARPDWGVPYYLRQAAPDIQVVSIGQGEDGRAPDGGFGAVLFAPGVDRPDPCAAFR